MRDVFLWGAHAARVQTPVRLGLSAASPKEASSSAVRFSPVEEKVRDDGATSPTRGGTCAPQP
jgi:hypothetical protein